MLVVSNIINGIGPFSKPDVFERPRILDEAPAAIDEAACMLDCSPRGEFGGVRLIGRGGFGCRARGSLRSKVSH